MKWMCLFLVVGGAEARPLTYSEALTAAVDANPALQRARIAEGQSQTDWKGAWGGYDPTYELGGTWRSSNDRGFFQGFPFESESGMVDMDTSISGTAPTGTTYSASMGLERNQSTFTTNFGGFLLAILAGTVVSTALVIVLKGLGRNADGKKGVEAQAAAAA